METTPFTLRRDGLICLALVLAVVAVFGQVHAYDFVFLDDDVHVVNNDRVKQGLSLDNFVWALTYSHGLWIPLATLSQMLDCTLFGLNPRGHHVENVLFHVANTILLFLVLRLMGGGPWRSAFAAALFALHPVHVEAVAWISSRKDVLSAFFWLLTMMAYLRYGLRPRALWYIAALACFCLGLLAKPIVLTLVGVLFLMDFWPLGRMDDIFTSSAERWKRCGRLLLEKVPFVLLTLADLVVAFVAQIREGALPSIADMPLTNRLSTACLGYLTYLTTTVWPVKLAPYYPHPMVAPPLWKVLGALLLLLAITVAVILRWRAQPYLLFGWFWYLGTLVPVIGLVQIGTHLVADRHTYVPLIGLFIMIAWGWADLAVMRPRLKMPLAGLASVVLVACSAAAWRQTSHWQDSLTLFRHSLAVTENNVLIHSNLGAFLFEQGKVEESIPHFKETVRLDPNDMDAFANLGIAFLRLGANERARKVLSLGVSREPDHVRCRVNLGEALFRQDKMEEAVEHLSKAVELGAQSSKIYLELGVAYGSLGDWERGADNLDKGYRLEPTKDNAHFVLAISYLAEGEVEQARTHLDTTLRLNPDHELAGIILGLMVDPAGGPDEQQPALPMVAD